MKFCIVLITFFTVFSVQASPISNSANRWAENCQVVPTFVQVPPICAGSALDPLPTTSTNGITGTWSPAINAIQTTTYTFTPNPGQDATTAVMTIVVNQYLSPTVTCGVWSANQKTFTWTAVQGATSYNLNYSINGGAYTEVQGISGLSYSINGVLAENNIFILVTPVGPVGSCFSVGTLDCQGSCNSAGLDGFSVACEGQTTPIQLFNLLGNAQPGGVFERISGTGGTFDQTAGTFTPAVGATSSAFQYTVLATDLCPLDTSLVNIFLLEIPNAGFDGCISVADTSTATISLNSIISGEGTSGTWTRTSGTGGTFSGVTGTYIPAPGATSSTFTYTVTGLSPCTNDASIATVLINEAASQSVVIFCDPSGATAANSVFFDWNSIGQTSFNYAYSINDGPIVRGNTTLSSLEVFDLPNGQSTVTITVQPTGGSTCYSATTFSCDRLSTAAFESKSIDYYPNPFHDILNLKFEEPVKSLLITNVLGQQVFSSDYNGRDFQVNLAHLTSGTYFVRADMGDAIRTFKIVKN